MNFRVKLPLLLTLFLLSSCITQHPRAIVYTSNWTDAYTTAILEQCMVESKMIAFYNVDYNYMSDMQAESMEKFLLDSCVKHYNITI